MTNENTNREKELTDRGWSEMQRMLETELPAAKRRRRSGWMFWSLAALLLSGSAGLAWYLNMQNNQTTPVQQPARDNPVIAQNPIHSQPGAALAPGASFAGNKSRRPGATMPLQAEIFAPVPPGPQAPALSGEKSDALQDNPANAGQNSLFAPEFAVAPAALKAFPGLPTGLPAAVVAPVRRLPALPESNIIKPASHRYLRPGIYVASALEMQQSSTALSAGLALDWQIWGRLGLRAGAGYQHVTARAGNRPFTLVPGAEYFEITGDTAALGTSFQAGASQNGDVLVPLNSLHRLEFPVQMWVQFLPRWRMYAGTGVNYTFGAKSSQDNLALKSNMVVSADNSAQKQALDKAVSSLLQQWDADLMLGVGFDLTRHLEIGLGYSGKLYFPFPSGQNTMELDASGAVLENISYIVNAPDRQRRNQLHLKILYRL